MFSELHQFCGFQLLSTRIKICPQFAKPYIQIAGPKNIQHNFQSKCQTKCSWNSNFCRRLIVAAWSSRERLTLASVALVCFFHIFVGISLLYLASVVLDDFWKLMLSDCTSASIIWLEYLCNLDISPLQLTQLTLPRLMQLTFRLNR